MSDQERQLNHLSEPLNSHQGDYKTNEEKALLALATLRLLNDEEHSLSLEQVIKQAHQLHETYKRWEQSKAAIKGITIRLNNSKRVSLAQIQGQQCNVRFGATLHAGTVLSIWKEADEEFEEVLLLSLSLSTVSTDGYDIEKSYPNGQNVSLRVERYTNGELSISAEVSEPKGQLHLESAEQRDKTGISRFYSMLHWPQKIRLGYALVALALMIVGTLQPLFSVRKNSFAGLSNSEFAQVLTQDHVHSTQTLSAANMPKFNRPSNGVTEYGTKSQQSDTQGVRYYASSFDNPSVRAKYCIDGEFGGESFDNANVIDVRLSEANLSLCNYSSHGARRIAMRVGVMNASGSQVKKIFWSRNIILTERLGPGETFSLSKPVTISIPKRRSVDVSKSKIIIQLINIPYDSNREIRTFLSDEDEAMVSAT